MRWRVPWSGESLGTSSSAASALPSMASSRLLKSWAMPPRAPQALELLRFQHLLLKPSLSLFGALEIGDVRGHAEQTRALALLVDDRDLDRRQPLKVAVGAGDLLAEDELWLASADDLPVVAAEMLDFFRVRVEIDVGLADDAVRGRTVGLRERAIREQEAAVPVLYEHEAWNGVDHGAQELALHEELRSATRSTVRSVALTACSPGVPSAVMPRVTSEMRPSTACNSQSS